MPSYWKCDILQFAKLLDCVIVFLSENYKDLLNSECTSTSPMKDFWPSFSSVISHQDFTLDEGSQQGEDLLGLLGV